MNTSPSSLGHRLRKLFAASGVRVGALLGSLAVLAILLFSGLGRTPQASIRSHFRYPVEVIEISPDRLRPEIELGGRVEAGARQALIASFDAWVERIEVRPGQSVEAGDVLAVLRPEHLHESLAAARLDLDNRRSERTEVEQRQRYLEQRLRIERAALARLIEVRDNAAKLRERAVITVMDYEVHHSAVDGRRLQVLDIERELQQLPLEKRRLDNESEKLATQIQTFERQLQEAELRAPVSAVVTAVSIEPGAHVSSGHSLITLAARDALQVVIPWPLETPIALADVDAYAVLGERRVALRVERVSAHIDAGHASPQAWLSPSTKDGDTDTTAPLVLGSHVQIRLQLPAIESAYAVPESALYNGERVYRLDDQGEQLNAIATQVAGQRYSEDGTLQWILASAKLRAGDQLLVSRLAAASEGLPVEARAPRRASTQMPPDQPPEEAQP
jgi:multidrug efflux pump subunit AcrA (membrane-fusion protein)